MQPNDSRTLRCALTASRTGSSQGSPKSLNIATRTPWKSRPSGLANWLPLSSMEMGERRSNPARTLMKNAQSTTLRATGPSTLNVNHPSVVGGFGTRPGEGRIPTTLQKFGGLRSEPPMSLPSASGTIPHASATAPPPVLPPQVLLKSYGFSVGPKTGLNVRSEEHTSELQSRLHLVCRLLLEKKKKNYTIFDKTNLRYFKGRRGLCLAAIKLRPEYMMKFAPHHFLRRLLSISICMYYSTTCAG